MLSLKTFILIAANVVINAGQQVDWGVGRMLGGSLNLRTPLTSRLWFYTKFIHDLLTGNVSRVEPNEYLVVDTDAGADDAMALSLVLNGTRGRLGLRFAGITCVRGNAGVHNVSKNVLRTLSVNNRLEIPVMEGSDYGLIAAVPTDTYFGDDGFGDFDYPVPDVPLRPEHPAVFLSNLVRGHPGVDVLNRVEFGSSGKVTVLALGPLTNLAVAGLLYPNFYAEVKEIVYLGGSTTGKGGGGSGVEFNNMMDPSAAIAVFSRIPSSNPITLIPTETTHLLKYSKSWRQDVLGRKGTDVINFLNLAERKEDTLSKKGYWKVDDPAAAAYFVVPSIVDGTFIGSPHLTPEGKMTVNEDLNGTVRVISSMSREKLKFWLYELL